MVRGGLFTAAEPVHQFVQRIGRDQDTAVLKRPPNRTVGCRSFEERRADKRIRVKDVAQLMRRHQESLGASQA